MKPQANPRKMNSTTKSIAAPTGGINAVDSIANMPATDAIVLDNWFPQPSYIQIRGGSATWKTGLPGWVETIMAYSNATAEKLFAASGSAFYDVTAQGAVGAAVVTGLTNARWEYTNVATPGGQFLYAANAVDKPELYDGTTWTAIDSGSTPAITGVTTTKLRNPVVWKNRVWFIENATLNAWYLPTQSIGGLAHKWDLGTIFRLGGQLQAIMTASITTSSTFEDYIAFMTTEGEIAVYAGTDPDTAGLFIIQGVYRVGKPVGRRCWFKSGSDALIICSDGIASLTALVRQGRGKKDETVSYKIQQLINSDIQSYKSNFGWQGVVHPLGNKLIINVPKIVNSVSSQYVMNTLNGSWCTYGLLNSPWNAACFEVLGDSLYYGGNTIVYLADIGNADNNNAVVASVLPAFSYFGTDRQKLFTMVRPMFTASGTVTAYVKLNTDFNVQVPTQPTLFPGTSTSPWNTSPWDVTPWSSGPVVRANWQTLGGIGFSATVYLKVATLVDEIQLNAIDYLYQSGGGVL